MNLLSVKWRLPDVLSFLCYVRPHHTKSLLEQDVSANIWAIARQTGQHLIICRNCIATNSDRFSMYYIKKSWIIVQIIVIFASDNYLFSIIACARLGKQNVTKWILQDLQKVWKYGESKLRNIWLIVSVKFSVPYYKIFCTVRFWHGFSREKISTQVAL